MKNYIEGNVNDKVGILDEIQTDEDDNDMLEFPFYLTGEGVWKFLYPYEEPPKQRMTNIQLMEWLAKGKGIFKYVNSDYPYYHFCRSEELLNNEVNKDVVIRSWDSEEWIEPTYEIYLKDCKGVTQEDIDDVAWRDGC